MITPAADHFHERSDDPYWNESAWFGFAVPDRDLTGFVYFFHRPNMNYTVGGVGVWDPSGEYEWDCLYYDWAETVAMSPGGDMFDFTTANGVTVACRKELQSFTLDYKGEDCVVDLSFEAFLEPQEAATGGQAGLPKGSDDWGKGHYNQPGRVEGTVTLGDEVLQVNSLSLRDHSWGPRRYITNPRGDFAWAFADERSGFCHFTGSDLSRKTDPSVGVREPMIFGWYLRDGESSRLVEGHRIVTERDDRGRPVRVECHGVDDSAANCTPPAAATTPCSGTDTRIFTSSGAAPVGTSTGTPAWSARSRTSSRSSRPAATSERNNWCPMMKGPGTKAGAPFRWAQGQHRDVADAPVRVGALRPARDFEKRGLAEGLDIAGLQTRHPLRERLSCRVPPDA